MTHLATRTRLAASLVFAALAAGCYGADPVASISQAVYTCASGHPVDRAYTCDYSFLGSVTTDGVHHLVALDSGVNTFCEIDCTCNFQLVAQPSCAPDTTPEGYVLPLCRRQEPRTHRLPRGHVLGVLPEGSEEAACDGFAQTLAIRTYCGSYCEDYYWSVQRTPGQPLSPPDSYVPTLQTAGGTLTCCVASRTSDAGAPLQAVPEEETAVERDASTAPTAVAAPEVEE